MNSRVFGAALLTIGGLLALAAVGLVGTLTVTAVGIVRGWVA